ncbi:MAG: DNA/RNA non-specific endonuclease [Crocinitomicaceae bacterium]|nr:DNA/RNA non-specific endonuclease [Crocinitomicaceae bacterium]
MNYLLTLTLLLFSFHSAFAQTELEKKTAELKLLKSKEQTLISEIEVLKLDGSLESIKAIGYPQHAKNLEILEHAGMVIGFDCDYKMASWVFHILTPDVSFGSVSRSNDFRTDEKSKCGTAEEADYFLKTESPDGTFEYDGFGFDRGHLAPSADFRWSANALSESYYYSNMTPQRPEFNRESWASLEDLLRRIVDQEKKSFYIITGPILHDSLPELGRSVNKLKVPELYYKIIVDASAENPRGMAFLMPNKRCEERLSSYVISIDSLERLTGINFFPSLTQIQEAKIEKTSDFSAWLTQGRIGDVEPLNAFELPKGYFNTRQAASKVGSTATIVGKVVSARYIPKSESTFLNLDQSFPNQIFSIMIWKDGRRNFSYKPEIELEGKYIEVKGKIELDKNGIPGMTVTKESQIKIWEELN